MTKIMPKELEKLWKPDEIPHKVDTNRSTKDYLG